MVIRELLAFSTGALAITGVVLGAQVAAEVGWFVAMLTAVTALAWFAPGAEGE